MPSLPPSDPIGLDIEPRGSEGPTTVIFEHAGLSNQALEDLRNALPHNTRVTEASLQALWQWMRDNRVQSATVSEHGSRNQTRLLELLSSWADTGARFVSVRRFDPPPRVPVSSNRPDLPRRRP